MKTKSVTGIPWELVKMLSEWNQVSNSVPKLLFLHRSEEARGKAEGCAAPQCSRGILRTWEHMPWVALSWRFTFLTHSYFSQGAAEVQANPDKGEKPEVSIKCPFSFLGCHAPNCLFICPWSTYFQHIWLHTTFLALFGDNEWVCLFW